MPENQTFPDGSVATRPGPLTFWRVSRGPRPHPFRLPPKVLSAVRGPGIEEECDAAAFVRRANASYRQFIQGGGYALHPTL